MGKRINVVGPCFVHKAVRVLEQAVRRNDMIAKRAGAQARFDTFRAVGEIVRIKRQERQSAWQGSKVSKANSRQGVPGQMNKANW